MVSSAKNLLLLNNIPSWVLRGASADLDFTHSRAFASKRTVLLSSLLSCSRASTGYAQNVNGSFVSFGANTLRITDQGLLIEEARTNSVRNNTMQGAVVGTPGTLSTNWNASTNDGLSFQIIGLGVENGINYIDARWFGTATGSSGQTLAFDTSLGIPALNGQTWTVAAFLRLQSGSLNGLTTNFRLSERDSGGSSLVSHDTSISISSGALGNGLISASSLLTNVSAAFILPQFQIKGYSSGTVIDVTIRIGWPQLELGAFATSPIPTSGAAAARAADVITAQGALLSAALNSQSARAESNFGEGITGNARLLDFNAVRFFDFNSVTTVQIWNGSVGATATIGGGGTNAGLVKAAFGYDGSSITSLANDNGAKVTNAVGFGIPTAPVYVGNIGTGIRALNGYFRRLTFGNTKGQFDGLTI